MQVCVTSGVLLAHQSVAARASSGRLSSALRIARADRLSELAYGVCDHDLKVLNFDNS